MEEIENLEQLGAMIRAARKQAGVTQDDLVFAADVSKTFVVDVERGKPTCEFDKVMRVARSVGLRLYASPAQREGAE